MAASDKTNLKRIRDNQRRSRARRRQYIQELETQIESYKTRGIEITAEIQQAARKVVEQNKKMRVLLNSLGFNNERIGYFLQTGDLSRDPIEVITSLDTSADQECSAETLEHLLMPHQPTNRNPEPYPAIPPTPKATESSNISNKDIDGFLSEVPIMKTTEQVDISRNLSFSISGSSDFTVVGPLVAHMPPVELAHHSPAELSDEQIIKGFQYDGISACPDVMPYGNDEDDLSYSSLSITPERTSSVSTGSGVFYNSHDQSYERLEYPSIMSCVDDDTHEDATTFRVPINPDTTGWI